MNISHLTLRRIVIAWLPAALVVVPNAGAEPQVVLGSVTDSGAVGYGTARPAAISLGTCANAIHDIAWSDWGGPTAHGEGTACQQSGTPPRYELIASNVGPCHGQTAYRTLQISTNAPQSICD